MTRSILVVGFGLFIVGDAAVGSAEENKPGVRAEGDRIVLETGQLAYVVGTNGLNQAFQDRRTGQNSTRNATAPSSVSVSR